MRSPATNAWTATSPAALARASPRFCGAFSQSTSAAWRTPPGRTGSSSSRPCRPVTATATSAIRSAGSSASSSRRPATGTSDCCVRSDAEVEPRAFSPERFIATGPIDGRSVLLIDDTWTTGASAQSAAAALRAAGAGAIASIVIGRHLNREWHENDRRIRGIARPFDWTKCALCAEPTRPAPRGPDLTGRPA